MRFKRLNKYLPGYSDGGEVMPEEQAYIQPEQQRIGYGTMVPAIEAGTDYAIRNAPSAAIAAFQATSPLAWSMQQAGNPQAQGDILGQISHVPGTNLAIGPLAGKLGRATKQVSPEVSALEKLKNLPMDYESRMARAKEMGFNTETPVYHGTANNFNEFDPSKVGNYGGGTYVTENPALAARYAGFRHYPGEKMKSTTGSNIMPLNIKNSIYRHSMDNNSKWPLIETLKKQGYTGMETDPGSYLIFDPKNIRSVNAAFDPAKKASKNILSGIAGIAAAYPLLKKYIGNEEE